MNVYFKIALCFSFFTTNQLAGFAQEKPAMFTHADTLRGTDGPYRSWWNILHYDLSVGFNIADSSIAGLNIIQFKAITTGNKMQIDLQEPMVIDSVFVRENLQFKNSRLGTTQKYKVNARNIVKDGNAYFILLNDTLQRNNIHYLFVYYHGKPKVAKRAPWDGGMVITTDTLKNPWISFACQNTGASVWYPCKDHQADEAESATMRITVPDSLVCVGNGRQGPTIQNGNSTATYTWMIKSPINNYNLVPYIGKYVHFSENYKGEKGILTMDYWALPYHLPQAKKQFKDASKMMKAFEHWFGAYPFYRDGYKLVEAPFLGMEHQSGIAYGNKFLQGYMGRDLSGTGWGLNFDFIIVHESGHEWFGNNITTKDIADMWVHEGFTNYSETLFTEYYYGKNAGSDYVIGTRKNVTNDRPVIGAYHVQNEGSGDMYYKAGNMIHIIRQLINNDEKFRMLLRGMNKDFYQQTVTTATVEQYIIAKTGLNLTKIFDQYLRTTKIPVLEYKLEKNNLQYRYSNCVDGFNMPIKINLQGSKWIYPTNRWKTLKLYTASVTTPFTVDRNFFVTVADLSL